MQVLPTPLSASSSVAVIVDGSMYGKSPCLSFLPFIMLIVVVAALRLRAVSSDEENGYNIHY